MLSKIHFKIHHWHRWRFILVFPLFLRAQVGTRSHYCNVFHILPELVVPWVWWSWELPNQKPALLSWICWQSFFFTFWRHQKWSNHGKSRSSLRWRTTLRFWFALQDIVRPPIQQLSCGWRWKNFEEYIELNGVPDDCPELDVMYPGDLDDIGEISQIRPIGRFRFESSWSSTVASMYGQPGVVTSSD